MAPRQVILGPDATVLQVATSLACWWPAYRASSVAPAKVLKQE